MAPTRGVLAWAKGDSVVFDFVFTGVEVMSGDEIQALVKASGKGDVRVDRKQWMRAMHVHSP